MSLNFMKNLLFSYGNMLISLLITLISLPLSLSYFGKDLFGLFSITNDSLAYLSLLNFGIPWAAATLFARLHSTAAQRLLIKRSLYLLSGLLVVNSILLWAIHNYFPNWINLIASIKQDIKPLASSFVLISVLFFILKLPFNLFSQFTHFY